MFRGPRVQLDPIGERRDDHAPDREPSERGEFGLLLRAGQVLRQWFEVGVRAQLAGAGALTCSGDDRLGLQRGQPATGANRELSQTIQGPKTPRAQLCVTKSEGGAHGVTAGPPHR